MQARIVSFLAFPELIKWEGLIVETLEQTVLDEYESLPGNT